MTSVDDIIFLDFIWSCMTLAILTRYLQFQEFCIMCKVSILVSSLIYHWNLGRNSSILDVSLFRKGGNYAKLNWMIILLCEGVRSHFLQIWLVFLVPSSLSFIFSRFWLFCNIFYYMWYFVLIVLCVLYVMWINNRRREWRVTERKSERNIWFYHLFNLRCPVT